MNFKRLSPNIRRDLKIKSLEMPVRDHKDFKEALEVLLASVEDLVFITRTALENADFYDEIVCFDHILSREESDEHFELRHLQAMKSTDVESIYSIRPHVHNKVILACKPMDIGTGVVSEAAFLNHIEPLVRAKRDLVYQDEPSSILKPQDLARMRQNVDSFLDTEARIDRVMLNDLLKFVGRVCRQQPQNQQLLQHFYDFQTFVQADEDYNGLVDWHKIGLCRINEGVIHFGQIVQPNLQYVRDPDDLRCIFEEKLQFYQGQIEKIIQYLSK